jgi:hypothetical protein
MEIENNTSKKVIAPIDRLLNNEEDKNISKYLL